MYRSIILPLLVLSAMACGGPAPSPAPASLVSLRGEMALLGVTTISAVAGESACAEQGFYSPVPHI